MSRKCDITGKRPLVGYNVSHAHNKTKKRQLPNLQTKRIFVPELRKSVRIKVSTSALRSIDKMGLTAFLRKNGLTLSDIT
ncbi:MAG: 50S ribosomal protein L28 [Gemmatimonadota bacterium]|nr:50S ribosomal protein L28 [Gemmatimonadota bacterium]MDE2784466.1 50S ribosomal protein L28 [Gemmatimonadota bacterium]MDE2866512.1 50S ribosomal protein L28 [Gemmatimonadota bacterium]MXV95756.1 50S ribosomal protein L28 [Gemmatimonadota bacterium]MYB07091.1 50S ribosomal protein L28 [Gemmatimonadota bacterium]